MKVFLSVLVIISLAWAILPIPLPGQYGVYNPLSGLLWCSSHYTCNHEVGHKLDDNGDWPSHSEKFSEAVYLFVGSELVAHDTKSWNYRLANAILRTPGVISWSGRWLDSQSEIYATIFAYADGKKENMPAIFQPFYDWNQAEQLIQKYQKYPREYKEEPWQ